MPHLKHLRARFKRNGRVIPRFKVAGAAAVGGGRTLYFDEGGRKKPEEVLQSATELSNGLNLQWCQLQRDETENSNTMLTAVRSRKPLGFSASYL